MARVRLAREQTQRAFPAIRRSKELSVDPPAPAVQANLITDRSFVQVIYNI